MNEYKKRPKEKFDGVQKVSSILASGLQDESLVFALVRCLEVIRPDVNKLVQGKETYEWILTGQDVLLYRLIFEIDKITGRMIEFPDYKNIFARCEKLLRESIGRNLDDPSDLSEYPEYMAAIKVLYEWAANDPKYSNFFGHQGG